MQHQHPKHGRWESLNIWKTANMAPLICVAGGGRARSVSDLENNQNEWLLPTDQCGHMVLTPGRTELVSQTDRKHNGPRQYDGCCLARLAWPALRETQSHIFRLVGADGKFAMYRLKVSLPYIEPSGYLQQTMELIISFTIQSVH